MAGDYKNVDAATACVCFFAIARRLDSLSPI
jgi:hypothetical protein